MLYLLKNKDDITTIFTLAIPVIMENILQAFIGTVDIYFAGSINDNAIAAIGVTNLVINLFIVFFTAISMGTSAIVARNFGKGEMDKVKEAVIESVFLGIIISLVLGIINIIFYKQILKVCGASNEILQLAIPYYVIVSVPIIFLCLSLILSSCLRSTKDTKTPMIATALANILNIILNILFMKMNMGITGLALATTISRCVDMIILIIKLKLDNIEIKLNKSSLKSGKDTLKSIVKIGAPAGMEKLIMRLGQIVYNSMIISIGVPSFVAHNIAGNIESYTYIPALGFGVATATLVGITLGIGDSEKSKEIVYLADKITIIFMMIVGINLFIFAPEIVKMFTKTKEVQLMVIHVLRLISLFQSFIAITQIFTSALQGAGDTKFPMYATLIGIWGIRVGIGYLLGVILSFGLFGVWMAYALDITIRGILLIIRFNYGKWKSIII